MLGTNQIKAQNK